jgi:hypothetical protein
MDWPAADRPLLLKDYLFWGTDERALCLSSGQAPEPIGPKMPQPNVTKFPALELVAVPLEDGEWAVVSGDETKPLTKEQAEQVVEAYVALVRFEAETKGAKAEKECARRSHHRDGDFQRFALDRLDIVERVVAGLALQAGASFPNVDRWRKCIIDCSDNPAGTSLSRESQQLVDWADRLKATEN